MISSTCRPLGSSMMTSPAFLDLNLYSTGNLLQLDYLLPLAAAL
jgi:hypothetical protein